MQRLQAAMVSHIAGQHGCRLRGGHHAPRRRARRHVAAPTHDDYASVLVVKMTPRLDSDCDGAGRSQRNNSPLPDNLAEHCTLRPRTHRLTTSHLHDGVANWRFHCQISYKKELCCRREAARSSLLLLLLLLLQMSWITVLPSHSCVGTLQNLDINLLHSSMQTSADHRSLVSS